MTAPLPGDEPADVAAEVALVAVAAAAESLAAEAGLDAAALGERAVERVVRVRLTATGLAPAAWAEHLRRDRAERIALVDAVVVGETRLFRDGSPFEALRAMAVTRVAAASIGRSPVPMRVLSVACSTGEEPYSAAIALLAGGLPPQAVEVVAFDVSRVSLRAAESGVLARTATRGPVPEWAEPWLERRDDGTVVVPAAVRERVAFRVANVLAPDVRGPFDAILCRNLLIYLTPPARARVAPWIRAQLAPDAPLFVGHAEVGVLLDGSWRRATGYGPYALEAVAATPRQITPPAPPPPAEPLTAAAPLAEAPRAGDAVAAAAALAHAGDRDAAVAMLDARVRAVPDDVEAHALLGVLHATAGRPAAARDALRRALYLDPGHAESRAQLALLDAGGPTAGSRS